MAQSPSPKRGALGVLGAVAIVIIAVLVLAPTVLAEGVGQLVAHVWVTALAAITALLAGLFSGA
jgi:hypothetical protein